MNWEHVEGKWQEMKGSIRSRWGKLTDDDLDVIAGKKDKLLGRLRAHYGDAKDKVESEVDEWLTSMK